jgi:protein-S-isoprenylcysteine O-methyltransferase Ste14
MVFFAAVGTLPLIMLAGRTTPADWPVAAVCTISLFVGLVAAWQGRKMRARLIDFQHRIDASSR